VTPLYVLSRLRRRARIRIAAPLVMAGLVTVLVSACGDDPFAIRWELQADTVFLYSLARPELNLNAGYNFRPGGIGTVRIEAASSTGQWDVALDTRGGKLVFLPPGALGVTSRARITALPGMARADVVEAPEDTLVYSADQPFEVELGTIYVVRTDRVPGAFGSRCVYYARVEPLIIDVAGGTLTFVYDSSPVCNSRVLIPPD
jgi:hypothetical protein